MLGQVGGVSNWRGMSKKGRERREEGGERRVESGSHV